MSICQTLLQWKIVPNLKMNYVMVDQQSGVDLTKQRLGLIKIVWLIYHSSKPTYMTQIQDKFFRKVATKAQFFKAYSLSITQRSRIQKSGLFFRAPEDLEGFRSQKNLISQNQEDERKNRYLLDQIWLYKLYQFVINSISKQFCYVKYCSII